jgi:hypothetical protein
VLSRRKRKKRRIQRIIQRSGSTGEHGDPKKAEHGNPRQKGFHAKPRDRRTG